MLKTVGTILILLTVAGCASREDNFYRKLTPVIGEYVK